MPEAYIEQSKTLDQDQPTWEIYPSCDVRMGEYFRKFPEAFARYVIDVNTDSIKDVLQTLDEDHSPRHSQQPTPLRFEVTPIETLQRKEGPLSHYMISGVYEDRVSRHWLRRRTIKTKPQNPEGYAKCTIGIGMQAVANAIARHEIFAKSSEQENTRPIVFPTHQSTAIHELQHAVDFKNKYKPSTSFILRCKNIMKRISANYTKKSIDSKLGDALHYQIYLDKPIEKRARKAQEKAHTFAPVISLHLSSKYN